jgi:hypothetical protein
MRFHDKCILGQTSRHHCVIEAMPAGDQHIGDMLGTQLRNTPNRSYRYTVAMFPLSYKNVLRYRTRQNVGGICKLVLNKKCTTEGRPHFAACGTPDQAIVPVKVATLEGNIEYGQEPAKPRQCCEPMCCWCKRHLPQLIGGLQGKSRPDRPMSC